MQSSQFPVAALKGKPVHVIGLGALGRPIAENLFRKRIPELHLHDHDIVEPHNCFNQRVDDADIGHPKVEVHARVFERIYPNSTTRLIIHPERVGPETALSGFVFSAVDWNRIRYQEVLPSVLRQKKQIAFFVDGRVGPDGGKVYGVDPDNDNHVYHYVEDKVHNHPDPPDGEINAACKSDFPMPENADEVAAAALWRLTRWLHLLQGSDDPYDNFVGWQYIPRRTEVTEQWDMGTVRAMRDLEDVAPVPKRRWYRRLFG